MKKGEKVLLTVKPQCKLYSVSSLSKNVNMLVLVSDVYPYFTMIKMALVRRGSQLVVLKVLCLQMPHSRLHWNWSHGKL